MLQYLTIFTLFVFLSLQISASPAPVPIGNSLALERRTDPVFPDSPPSCPICQQNYPSINSCAQAAPVLANFSMIIFNPGAFLDVIKCACGDTFQSVFPQCVDCFIQTDQDDVLNTPDLPGLVNDTRKICALESTLLGNVSGVNSSESPTPTPTSGGMRVARDLELGLAVTISLIGMSLLAGYLGF
ncbi:hypothetical protein BDZ97DRAFT_1790486 [Flammula alnicola]|nr:hypothetical protein BDZ97DRAFT_1790486 [Flammula alnicola]